MAEFDHRISTTPEGPIEQRPADAGETPEAPVKNRVTARTAALVGVRAVVGTVGVGIAILAIAAAALVPLPTVQADAPSVRVTPVPTAQQLVCPGTFLRLGDEQGQDATTAAPLGTPEARFDSTAGSVDEFALEGGNGSPGTPTRLSLPAGDAGDAGDARDASSAALLAGAQSQLLAAGEFGGLAAASCAGAATESWLVGGSTAVGRTTLVTIANPSDVAATVNVEIFAEDGPVTAPGVTGIVVQPHSQRVLSLAGFAPGITAPVVHVTSRGGQVVTSMQQATVRGLDPGGIDIFGATTAPADRHVIPGLVTANSIALRGALGAQGYDDLPTVVRLLAPGEAGATATVSIVPDDGLPADEAAGNEPAAEGDGTTRGTTFTVELIGDRVLDIPVENLKDGSYTVTVEADAPVVAGLRTSIVAGEPSDTAAAPDSSDFAWVAAAAELTAETLVTVAPGPGARLHLSNPTSAAATVEVEEIEGESRSVEVPAGAATSVTVSSGTTYRLSGFSSVYAAITFASSSADGAQLAAYPVLPGAASATPLTVYPR